MAGFIFTLFAAHYENKVMCIYVSCRRIGAEPVSPFEVPTTTQSTFEVSKYAFVVTFLESVLVRFYPCMGFTLTPASESACSSVFDKIIHVLCLRRLASWSFLLLWSG